MNKNVNCRVLATCPGRAVLGLLCSKADCLGEGRKVTLASCAFVLQTALLPLPRLISLGVRPEQRCLSCVSSSLTTYLKLHWGKKYFFPDCGSVLVVSQQPPSSFRPQIFSSCHSGLDVVTLTSMFDRSVS